MPAIVTVGAQLMARALVTKLRIPDTAAQTRKSPVARSGRAEASCHDISNTWLAHGYSSSGLTTPARQSGLHQLTFERSRAGSHAGLPAVTRHEDRIRRQSRDRPARASAISASRFFEIIEPK